MSPGAEHEQADAAEAEFDDGVRQPHGNGDGRGGGGRQERREQRQHQALAHAQAAGGDERAEVADAHDQGGDADHVGQLAQAGGLAGRGEGDAHEEDRQRVSRPLSERPRGRGGVVPQLRDVRQRGATQQPQREVDQPRKDRRLHGDEAAGDRRRQHRPRQRHGVVDLRPQRVVEGEQAAEHRAGEDRHGVEDHEDAQANRRADADAAEQHDRSGDGGDLAGDVLARQRDPGDGRHRPPRHDHAGEGFEQASFAGHQRAVEAGERKDGQQGEAPAEGEVRRRRLQEADEEVGADEDQHGRGDAPLDVAADALVAAVVPRVAGVEFV